MNILKTFRISAIPFLMGAALSASIPSAIAGCDPFAPKDPPAGGHGRPTTKPSPMVVGGPYACVPGYTQGDHPGSGCCIGVTKLAPGTTCTSPSSCGSPPTVGFKCGETTYTTEYREGDPNNTHDWLCTVTATIPKPTTQPSRAMRSQNTAASSSRANATLRKD